MKKKLFLSLMIFACASPHLIFASTPFEHCPNNNPYHVLVNKNNLLSNDYVPKNLVMPNVRFNTPGDIDKNYMEKDAAKALEEMFNAAKKDNITLIAVSGYRSYNYQNNLYQRAIKNYGKDQIGTARPNESEHRTGLAMDITGIHGGTIEESFAYTPEGQWLAKNCYKYGFIIRYPKDKTNITGYIYEPWHVRYVGKDYAKTLHEKQLTMEEYRECCFKTFTTSFTINKKNIEKPISLIKDNGKLYIGLRDFANLLQANLSYDPISKQSTLSFRKKRLIIKNHTINQTSYKTLTINDLTYIPLREASDLLNIKILEIDPLISHISLKY